MKEYALYKGDELLGIGTVKELAQQFNVTPGTIRWYGFPTYQKRVKNPKNRRVLVPLED